jgi:hypothetical protein
MKREIYREYEITDHSGYVIDHLVPVELGGKSTLSNLWPQKLEDSERKDRLEARLHALVISGQLDLSTAQKAISENWIATYKTYVHD